MLWTFLASLGRRAPGGALLLLVGCGVDCDEPCPRNVVITPIDTTVLEEPDSLPLGRPSGLVVDNSGNTYVNDVFFDRVISYDRAGHPKRIFGSKGDGPREVRGVMSMALVGDTILMLFDGSKHVAKLFSIGTGDYVGAVRFDGFKPHAGVGVGDSLVIGALDLVGGTSVAVWRLGSEKFDRFGYAPGEYNAYPRLGAMHGQVSVARGRERFFVGFSGIDSVIAYSLDWKRLEAGHLPATLRRGRPKELNELFRGGRSFPEYVHAVASLDEIGALSSGRVAILYQDVDVVGNSASAVSKPFVGVLGADLKASCGETRLNVASDSRITGRFVGDTLVLVTQTVSGQTSVNRLLRFYVDDRGC